MATVPDQKIDIQDELAKAIAMLLLQNKNRSLIVQIAKWVVTEDCNQHELAIKIARNTMRNGINALADAKRKGMLKPYSKPNIKGLKINAEAKAD